MLQGSLENFALDEVLGLLASTSKTGQLEIAGNRGTGKLMFNDGRLVDGGASHTANGTGLEDVMFELLRYEEGTFTFTMKGIDNVDHPENVGGVLAAAENRLRDWREIEAVVPTLDHQVTPAVDLPEDEVTISRGEWAALTVIAAGCPVSLVCETLDLGEVEGSRQIKNLAERELVIVSEPVAAVSGTTSLGSSAASTAATSSFGGASVLAASAGTTGTPAGGSLATASTVGNGNGEAPAALDSVIGSSDTAVLTEERPPLPPAPGLDDPVYETGDDQVSALASAPPPPPPPPLPTELEEAEAQAEQGSVDNGSESVDHSGTEDSKGGGLLSRYRKGDD